MFSSLTFFPLHSSAHLWHRDVDKQSIKQDYTFAYRILRLDLVYNSKTKLSRAAPTIREVGWVSNIQVHWEVVHIVSLGENQHTPAWRSMDVIGTLKNRGRKKKLHGFCRQDNGRDQELTIWIRQRQKPLNSVSSHWTWWSSQLSMWTAMSADLPQAGSLPCSPLQSALPLPIAMKHIRMENQDNASTQNQVPNAAHCQTKLQIKLKQSSKMR